MAVVEKAESIAGLVNFFSDSPLDGLKDGGNVNPKAAGIAT